MLILELIARNAVESATNSRINKERGRVDRLSTGAGIAVDLATDAMCSQEIAFGVNRTGGDYQ
jgi:hypothetical protein